MQTTWLRLARLVPTSLRLFLEANAPLVKSSSAALHTGAGRIVVAETNSDSIYANLATEEALIRGLTLDQDQCLVLLYVNRPCVVVGRNQNLFQEVALRRARHDGVDVARRASGGGAVFHDCGNLCFSFLTHRTRYAPEKTIQLVRLGLCAAYGVDPARLTTTGRHDLFLDAKKITGSAMRVQRDIAYHHCTLLVDTPHPLLGRYLHPEGVYEAFQSSSVGSVRSPVTTLTEAGCVPSGPQSGGGRAAVQDARRSMADFFFDHAVQLLDDAAPWDTNVTELRHAAADSRGTAEHPLYQLDVVQAIAEGMPFIEGEGRRLSNGDATTLCEAVAKAQSREWAYAMPPFTSTVSVQQVEVVRGLRALPSWTDAVRLSSLSEEEVLAELTQLLFDPQPPQQDVNADAPVLQLRTTVEHGTVTRLDVVRRDSTDVVEWLARFLSTLLVGRRCDAAVAGIEVAAVSAADDPALLARGFVHEAGDLAPDPPDLARDLTALMVVKVLLAVWRDKNVFDVCV